MTAIRPTITITSNTTNTETAATDPITVVLTPEGLEGAVEELVLEGEAEGVVLGGGGGAGVPSSGLHSLSPKEDIVTAQLPSALSSWA